MNNNPYIYCQKPTLSISGGPTFTSQLVIIQRLRRIQTSSFHWVSLPSNCCYCPLSKGASAFPRKSFGIWYSYLDHYHQPLDEIFQYQLFHISKFFFKIQVSKTIYKQFQKEQNFIVSLIPSHQSQTLNFISKETLFKIFYISPQWQNF